MGSRRTASATAPATWSWALIEAVSGGYFETSAPRSIGRRGCGRRTRAPDEVVEGRAVGYIPPEEAEARAGEGLQVEPAPGGTRGTPAGGGRFARALVEGKLVKPETLATLLQPRVPFLPGSSYGYGFVVREGEEGRTFGHSGGFPGVSTSLSITGDGAWTLVVLSNVSEGAGPVVDAWNELARRLAP